MSLSRQALLFALILVVSAAYNPLQQRVPVADQGSQTSATSVTIEILGLTIDGIRNLSIPTAKRSAMVTNAPAAGDWATQMTITVQNRYDGDIRTIHATNPGEPALYDIPGPGTIEKDEQSVGCPELLQAYSGPRSV
ncbi:hypothetical protein VFPBJ_11231 [Purpureocillium lilacinum]|uniref:Uncharacterized protein n=1 Tax=Purpureocillium lilacinum TaxID=33203 RepID=A0A179FEZ8_PURLI|nr:hypothetical protein VFPBJ_11231 [Purpureocillium lilacinum]